MESRLQGKNGERRRKKKISKSCVTKLGWAVVELLLDSGTPIMITGSTFLVDTNKQKEVLTTWGIIFMIGRFILGLLTSSPNTMFTI